MRNFESNRVEVLEFQDDSTIRTLYCELRKSKRARRLNLRLKSPTHALLTFPYRMSWQVAEDFLSKQKSWLQQKSLEFPPFLSLKQHFSRGGEICLNQTLLERTVRIVENCSNDRPRVSLENQEIGIYINAGKKDDVQIKQVCRKLACQFLPGWTEWAADQVGLFPKKVRIGDQRTRWGSCSPKGTLSLNWRIILLPKELGSYVIFHELAHLAQMNHSPKFWQKLEEFVPNAKAVDRKLTKDGKVIFSLGRSG